MANELLTIREAVAKAAEYFRAKGIEAARLDAELLVGAAAGLNRLQVYLDMDRPLTEGERERARELVRRRSTHEPVAYILGRREFMSREFEVTPAVLIPRPETELLVEHAEKELARIFPGGDGAYRILEFGTGSGAIAVSLAADLPRAQIVATEISEAAAEIARRNAQKHGVAERVVVHVQPDFTNIPRPFRAVVSNPPYVAAADKAGLPADVVNFEPHGALFSGDDGLDAIRFLIRESPGLLEPDGFLLMEIGAGQAERVREIGAQHALETVSIVRDYAGIERCVQMKRRPGA